MIVAVSFNPLFGQSGKDSTSKSIQLPVVELNIGYGFLFSDHGLTTGLGGSNAQLNYQLSINQPILPYLSAGINLGTTKFSDDIMLDNLTNVNYRSVVFSQDVSFYYEASHLFKSNKRGYKAVQPYLGFGLGIVSFRSKGDLKDENGNIYHHWSDGSIRDIAESDPNAEAAVLLMRDRTFESDLRDANLDGLGRYDQLAFRMPMEVGLRYQITKNVGVNVKVRYHMNFTDLIDNITVASAGQRAGTSGSDQHLTASIGFSAFLGRHTKKQTADLPPPVIAIAENTESSDTTQTENVSDSETVAESNSDSEAEEETAAQNSDPEINDSLAVDAQSENPDEGQEGNLEATETEDSKADELLDSEETGEESDPVVQEEKDGTEISTQESVTVGQNRPEDVAEVTANENDSENGSTEGADPSESNSKTEIDLLEAIDGFDGTEPKEVGDYHWADINQDRYISSTEVLHFIDLLFDGGSEYDVPMIHSLIEYYFDQD